MSGRSDVIGKDCITSISHKKFRKDTRKIILRLCEYVPKFGQLNNLADNLKSLPGGPADNQANNLYFIPWRCTLSCSPHRRQTSTSALTETESEPFPVCLYFQQLSKLKKGYPHDLVKQTAECSLYYRLPGILLVFPFSYSFLTFLKS